MIFALMYLGAAAEGDYCNESTELPENFVCCHNSICDGFCAETTGMWRCATHTEKFYCIDAYNGILITIAACVFPTVLFWLISLILRTKLFKVVVIMDILTNICLGLSIYGAVCTVDFIWIGIYPLALGLCFFIMLFFFRCSNMTYNCDCGYGTDMTEEDFKKYDNAIRYAENIDCCCECCKTKKGDYSSCAQSCECLEVLKQLRSPKVTKEDLDTIIFENHVIPPTPQIKVVDFNKGSKGETIIVKTSNHPVEYATWQEETAIPGVPNDEIVVYKCHSKYIYTEAMKQRMDNAEVDAFNTTEKVSRYKATMDIAETPGFTNRAIAINERTKMVDCCSSCFMVKFFYKFLVLIGYSSIVDLIWLSRTSILEETSIKKIADDDSLRAKCGERDRQFYATIERTGSEQAMSLT